MIMARRRQQPSALWYYFILIIAALFVCVLFVVVQQHPSTKYILRGEQEVVRSLLLVDGGKETTTTPRQEEGSDGRVNPVVVPVQHPPLPFNENLVHPSDIIYDDVYHSPIVLEEYKLIFFDIYKNACTGWKILFYKMIGKEYKAAQFAITGGGNSKWGPLHAPRKNSLVYLYNYNLTYANHIMQDPNWTRAIFVRNPHERLLSAYLFLKQPKSIHLYKQACCTEYQQGNGKAIVNKNNSHNNNNCTSRGAPSFEEFVKTITSSSTQCQYADKHWEAQSLRMDTKYWQYLNFIGHHENLFHDAELLLRKIGAWDKYGKYVTGGGEMEENGTNNSSSTTTKPIQSVFGSTGGQHHATGANERFNEYYYSNNEVYERVADYYRNDYDHPILDLHTRYYKR